MMKSRSRKGYLITIWGIREVNAGRAHVEVQKEMQKLKRLHLEELENLVKIQKGGE